MAAELVDTSRLYARCIAQIQPEWLEKVGSHLLKKSWGDAHWEKKPAQVTAFERATLYGLVVYSHRRVLRAYNPKEARDIFIREALVNGDFESKAPFYLHNQKLMREIENLEHKSRRTDVLVDDSLIAAFYDKHIPETVFNGFSFEKWLKEATRENPKLLFLDRDDLMRHEAAGITTELFPKTFSHSGIDMTLNYHFEPGNPRDGITLNIPIYALNQLDAQRCEWLVLGMLKEKTQLLIKSLPQRIRRNCVPLPEYSAGFVDRILEKNAFGSGPLVEALIEDIRSETNAVAKTDDFRLETLPSHLFMNFRVVDEHGRMLEMSRNLSALQAEFSHEARSSFQQLAEKQAHRISEKNPKETPSPAAFASAGTMDKPPERITTWNFEPLPELLEITRGKQTLFGYPALVDKETHCEIEVFDEPALAKQMHHAGLRRLFTLQLKDQLKFLSKNISGLTQMGMQFIKLGSQEELRDQLLQAAVDSTFMVSPLPKTQTEFEKRKNEGKARLGLIANEIARLASQILSEYQNLQKKLPAIRAHEQTLEDINQQVSQLVTKRFITENDLERLKHFPRYLKACNVRIDKCRNEPQKDKALMGSWQQVATPYQRALRDSKQSKARFDPKMLEYRWLLEELRVSLFAQELRTPFPVSVKRLQKVWDTLQR